MSAVATASKYTDRCERLVHQLTLLTGIEWRFGYIGNLSARNDDRIWYAFAEHPGRVGKDHDRIGGYRTHELADLASELHGTHQLARVLNYRVLTEGGRA